jgi:hypothetical protein
LVDRQHPVAVPTGAVDSMHPASRPLGECISFVRPSRLSCRFVVRPKSFRTILSSLRSSQRRNLVDSDSLVITKNVWFEPFGIRTLHAEERRNFALQSNCQVRLRERSDAIQSVLKKTLVCLVTLFLERTESRKSSFLTIRRHRERSDAIQSTLKRTWIALSVDRHLLVASAIGTLL